MASAAEAIADIEDGASVGIAGFGLSHRYPSTLISALAEKGTRGLTVYCNGLGQPGFPTGHVLAENHQIAHLVTCFSARPGVVSEAEKQIDAGEMTLEMVPQGTLVERMRAGGAGLGSGGDAGEPLGELALPGELDHGRELRRREVALGLAVGEGERPYPVRVAGGEDLGDGAAGVVAHQVHLHEPQAVAQVRDGLGQPVHTFKRATRMIWTLASPCFVSRGAVCGQALRQRSASQPDAG